MNCHNGFRMKGTGAWESQYESKECTACARGQHIAPLCQLSRDMWPWRSSIRVQCAPHSLFTFTASFLTMLKGDTMVSPYETIKITVDHETRSLLTWALHTSYDPNWWKCEMIYADTCISAETLARMKTQRNQKLKKSFKSHDYAEFLHSSPQLTSGCSWWWWHGSRLATVPDPSVATRALLWSATLAFCQITTCNNMTPVNLRESTSGESLHINTCQHGNRATKPPTYLEFRHFVSVKTFSTKTAVLMSNSNLWSMSKFKAENIKNRWVVDARDARYWIYWIFYNFFGK